ncbi:MAG: sigma 54-interacting transcriptional regulator [Pseudomonadales bacterium]
MTNAVLVLNDDAGGADELVIRLAEAGIEGIRVSDLDQIPISDVQELSARLHARFRQAPDRTPGAGGVPAAVNTDIVCASPGSRRCFELATRVASTDVAVLVSGASGTGKEVIARHIHNHSPRASGEFIAINCAAIPENMLEAILFGHVKGAFTGALSSQPGKFELADNGTLLLDEITEMPLGLQAKLLRVLQEREVERVGGRGPIAVNVRVIATTNVDIRAAIAAGRFREDLYYRLSVFPLQLPPLCERSEDIVELARHFLVKHGRRIGRCDVALSTQSLRVLEQHSWPGNVRELENAIQRALVMCSGSEITPADLNLETQTPATTTCVVAEEGLRAARFEAESDIILRALRGNDGHRGNTARELGISERTLRYKVKRLREAGLLEN